MSLLRVSAILVGVLLLLSATLTFEVRGEEKLPAAETLQVIEGQVVLKNLKRMTLISVKNTGETDIGKVFIKVEQGSIRHVKAKYWDRDRVDDVTVSLTSTKDPLRPDDRMVILLLWMDRPDLPRTKLQLEQIRMDEIPDISKEGLDRPEGGNSHINFWATARAPSADLYIESLSDDPDPVAPGGAVTYTLTVCNAGPTDEPNTAVRIFINPPERPTLSSVPYFTGSVSLQKDSCETATQVVPIAEFLTVAVLITGTTTNDPDFTNNVATETTTVISEDTQ